MYLRKTPVCDAQLWLNCQLSLLLWAVSLSLEDDDISKLLEQVHSTNHIGCWWHPYASTRLLPAHFGGIVSRVVFNTFQMHFKYFQINFFPQEKFTVRQYMKQLKISAKLQKFSGQSVQHTACSESTLAIPVSHVKKEHITVGLNLGPRHCTCPFLLPLLISGLWRMFCLGRQWRDDSECQGWAGFLPSASHRLSPCLLGIVGAQMVYAKSHFFLPSKYTPREG